MFASRETYRRACLHKYGRPATRIEWDQTINAVAEIVNAPVDAHGHNSTDPDDGGFKETELSCYRDPYVLY